MQQNAVLIVDESQPTPAADRPAQPPTVVFSNVWRHWGRGAKRWPVLRGVELDAAPGTITCVRGRNGVGKTTLLRIATGILTPDTGRVTIDGLSAEDRWRDYHRKIGFLSAGDRGLYARVTVRAHLEYWVRVAFVPRPQRNQLVHEALERFELETLAGRRADRLSQGQRQRLRLALAMVHRPKVLLLDEPRNSLDGEGTELLAAAVADLVTAGGTVIWCAPVGEKQPVQFNQSFVLEAGRLSPV